MLVSAVPLTSTLEGGRLSTCTLCLSGSRKSLVTMLIIFHYPACQSATIKSASDSIRHDLGTSWLSMCPPRRRRGARSHNAYSRSRDGNELGSIYCCAELHAWKKSTGSCRPATVTTARLEKHQKKTPDQDSPCQPSATYRRARFWGMCNANCLRPYPGEVLFPETASRCFGDASFVGL